MDSSTSSQANQPYSLLNRVTLDIDFEQLINSQDYYQRQDYSIGQGLVYGSFPVDDDADHSPVEEMSPVKAKKASKRASRAKKNDIKDKELPNDWTKAEEIALCQVWCDVLENSEKGNSIKAMGFGKRLLTTLKRKLVEREEYKRAKKSKTSETTSGSASGGFNLNNEAGEYEEEAQEHRPMALDRSKAKKKSSTSSREGSSSFVDLVADKYLGIKSKKWEKMQEQ
ncbi:hypothetical protein Tco_0520754 [Tanacetum coccineum]